MFWMLKGTVKRLLIFATATSTERPSGLMGSQRYAAPERCCKFRMPERRPMYGHLAWCYVTAQMDCSMENRFSRLILRSEAARATFPKIDSRRDSDLVRGLWTLACDATESACGGGASESSVRYKCHFA